MKYYDEETEKVLKAWNVTEEGLSDAEAQERQKKHGKNKLVEAKGKSTLVRFLEQFADPMILILIAAAVVSGVLSWIEKEGYTDSIIILIVVLINAVLGVYQENKAEKAIEALQKMNASTSKVKRDGKVITIPSESLVPGDIILLEAGDSVPADARLIESASLKVEEAALTGESVPVEKHTSVISGSEIPLAERKNMIYMGTNVVYGRCQAVVVETGMHTEMGKIAGALQSAKEGQTPLQKKLSYLSRVLTWIVIGISIVVFAIQILRSGSFDFSTALDSFMVAVSLAVAAIPEGLAAVVTVVLSIGVTNMAKRNAIIRKLTAVETLGSAQVICTDKTGTLTQNRMDVVDCFTTDEDELAVGMALCCDAELNQDGSVTGEPTEAALVSWSAKLKHYKYDLKKKYPRVKEVPFDSMRKLMTTIHRDGDAYVQFTKGAPDEVIALSSMVLDHGVMRKMTEEDRKQYLEVNSNYADRALRVLACAKKVYIDVPEDGKIENDLCLIGLCAMMDPVREEVKDAIALCKAAGVRPVMITGDHVDTARAIASQLHILEDGQKAVTGSELDAMSDETFASVVKDISVYARVQPEHKTRIVREWQKAGYVTAMTGDGVNDAPSIKTADIGVGMGITGTDVTKNVADMVLSDDNFASIVGAVEEGRRIYDNIRKAMQFLLGSNLSEVLSIFTATLLGFTILRPVHLLWINLITDTFPALALGMEKAEDDVMQRKPRETDGNLFSDGMGFDIVYQAVLVTGLTLASYFLGHYLETGTWQFTDSAAGTTMAFLTLSMAEIFHSFNMRSQRKSIFAMKKENHVLVLAGLGAFVLTTVVCEVPFLADAFGFTSVGFTQYLYACLLGMSIIPIVEGVKWVQRKTVRK